MAEIAQQRHHGGGEGLRGGGGAAVVLVAAAKSLFSLVLVVENLDDLLSLDHLFDVTVDNTDVLLLLGKVAPAALAHGHHHQQHQQQCEHCYQEQQGTHDNHHHHHADKGQRAGDNGAQTVVEHLGNGLNVVGVAAHQFPVGVGIKVAEGQVLHLGEQVPPNGLRGRLGDTDHDPGVDIAAQRSRDVDRGQEAQHFPEARDVAGENIIVGQGLEHEGAGHGAGAAEKQAQRHDDQQELGAAQIAQKPPDGLAHILRPLVAPRTGAVHGTVFSHGAPPPPVEIGIRRGRSPSAPSAPHGCRCPSPGRHPSPRSDPHP